jgi:hypothetical protein
MRVCEHIVCSGPDCGWGWPLRELSESPIRKCYEEFRQHCIETHGLDPNDPEANVHLDLVKYTLTLLR